MKSAITGSFNTIEELERLSEVGRNGVLFYPGIYDWISIGGVLGLLIICGGSYVIRRHKNLGILLLPLCGFLLYYKIDALGADWSVFTNTEKTLALLSNLIWLLSYASLFMLIPVPLLRLLKR